MYEEIPLNSNVPVNLQRIKCLWLGPLLQVEKRVHYQFKWRPRASDWKRTDQNVYRVLCLAVVVLFLLRSPTGEEQQPVTVFLSHESVSWPFQLFKSDRCETFFPAKDVHSLTSWPVIKGVNFAKIYDTNNRLARTLNSLIKTKGKNLSAEIFLKSEIGLPTPSTAQWSHYDRPYTCNRWNARSSRRPTKVHVTVIYWGNGTRSTSDLCVSISPDTLQVEEI